MNSPATPGSRRRFLTRLFTDADNIPAVTRLVPLEDLSRQTDGVLWTAILDGEGILTVAGDDGLVFRRDGNAWQSEDFPGTLPIHALCAVGARLYSVGWLAGIDLRTYRRPVAAPAGRGNIPGQG